MSPFALPPAPPVEVAPSWFYCSGVISLRFEREVKAAIVRVRRRFPPRAFTVPARIRLPVGCRDELRPVDVAHWLPNMPRGHEPGTQGCRAPVIRAANAPSYRRR